MEANTTAVSSSWTIKTKNNNSIAHYEPSPTAACDPFEDRLSAFTTEPRTRRFLQGLYTQSVNELKRRNAERLARKASNGTVAAQPPSATITEATTATTVAPPQANVAPAMTYNLGNSNDHQTFSDEFNPFHFLDVNVLPSVEQKAWQAFRKDQSLTYPHQWVRLASLFSVQSKTLRQPSLLTRQNELVAIEDCGGQKPVVESYLKIRDTQNRNYARDSVNEGIAAFKQENVPGALSCYKRALDMDPKYAEGWFRVAEGLLYQRNKAEAIENLERALQADPTHVEARALLESTQSSQKRDTEIRRGGGSSVGGESRRSLSESSRRRKRDDDSVDRTERRRRRREEEDKRKAEDSSRRYGHYRDDDEGRRPSKPRSSRRRRHGRDHRHRRRNNTGSSDEETSENRVRRVDHEYNNDDHSSDRRSRRRRRNYSKDRKDDHRRQGSHEVEENSQSSHRHHSRSCSQVDDDDQSKSSRLHNNHHGRRSSHHHQSADEDEDDDPMDIDHEGTEQTNSNSHDPMSDVQENEDHRGTSRKDVGNLDEYEDKKSVGRDENHDSDEKRKYNEGHSKSSSHKKRRRDEHKTSRRREEASLERHRRRHDDEKVGGHRSRSHRRHSRSSPRPRRR